jgi:bifunctional pyridoxal-dependent enzyme with beta-cystathionase and maltose regulon repressor activities
MRLSFACSKELLEKAIERMRAVLPATAQAKTA